MISLSEIVFTDKEEQQKYETCDGCMHLYYNNDGGVACSHQNARACLWGYRRIFKEIRRIV